MKRLLIGLLFPLCTFGQTIHHDGETIRYNGSVNIGPHTASEIRSHLQAVFLQVAGKMADSVNAQAREDALKVYANIRLSSPYHIIKRMHFNLLLKPLTNGYTYEVDSVFVTEKRRGWKEKTTTAKEMIEALEETGNAAIELEILLNEMDLRLQKLLTVLENNMKKATAQKQNTTASNRGSTN